MRRARVRLALYPGLGGGRSHGRGRGSQRSRAGRSRVGAGSAPPLPFTLSATEACLKNLPGAVIGLPPANPPTRPTFFVYRHRPDRFDQPEQAQLGVWWAHGKQRFYGVVFRFLKSAPAAHAHKKTLMEAYSGRLGLWGGAVIRNVIALWDEASSQAAVREQAYCAAYEPYLLVGLTLRCRHREPPSRPSRACGAVTPAGC